MNEIAKLLSVFLCSFIVKGWSTPDGLSFSDGNPAGLCDLQKHEVLAPKYSSITYVGHGIFFGTQVEIQQIDSNTEVIGICSIVMDRS